MNDEQYIKLAMEEAKKSVEAGGAPIGAVMVKNGRMDSGQWMNMSAKPILLKPKSAQHSVHLTACGVGMRRQFPCKVVLLQMAHPL